MPTGHHDEAEIWDRRHPDAAHQRGSDGLFWVLVLSSTTMVAEIAAGYATGSLALLADGWHMGSHVAALGLAYTIQRAADSPNIRRRLTFGAGKLRALGGYSSAMILAGFACWMAIESIRGLIAPRTVDTGPALVVAVIGLAVNLASAFLLHRAEGHGPTDSGHVDHNHRAAFMHVVADAATSVLAIFALLAARHLGWSLADPLMGLLGAVVICYWAYGLVRETLPMLLDVTPQDVEARVRAALATSFPVEVVDVHVWYMTRNQLAASIVLIAHEPLTADAVRHVLANEPHLTHITVEISVCATSH